MTRINCIPVTELTREHLVAEYRELPRVFTLIKKAIERGEKPDDSRNPKEYVLGTGHVRFFYDKALWLYCRQGMLIREMRRRDYTVNFDEKMLKKALKGITVEWRQWWNVTPEAQELNRARIKERNSDA